MISKRRKWVLALAGVLSIAAGIALLLNREEGPFYQGKRLSEWVSIYRLEPDDDVSRQAIRSIGAEGYPYLIKWIDYERPAWRIKLSQLIPYQIVVNRAVARLVYGDDSRATAAASAFRALGTNAAPTIPALEAMMNNSKRPSAARLALFALGYMGEPALPALTNAFANPHQNLRYMIPVALDLMAANASNCMSRCTSVLREHLNDPDPMVSLYTTMCLRDITHEPLTNAPTSALPR
ncbi:MAG TPA: HEAT repeat domain-containing protein [Verrucomicrobiae bacterium]|nr:HEAT repeat domain-containing protein [Verrucomicrobiae bacterium]